MNARYRGFRKKPRTWPLLLGLVVLVFGVGVWAWPYWQAKNDVPANTNGTMVANENVGSTNIDTTRGTNINGVNDNTSVPANTNETNANATNNNANVNVPANTNSNTPPKYDTPISSNERTHGNTTRKEVVLTFDAGSGTQSAQQILDTLKKNNVPGTFFVTGTWAQKNTALLKTIHNDGFAIYNHTMTHPHLPTLTDAQIKQQLDQVDTIVKNATGVSTKPYFRAPYGDRNAHVLSVAAADGCTSVYWTTDGLDWEESSGVTALQVKDRILNNLKPGAIYLMHVGDTLTGTVLDNIITGIKKQGYVIVRLDRALE